MFTPEDNLHAPNESFDLGHVRQRNRCERGDPAGRRGSVEGPFRGMDALGKGGVWRVFECLFPERSTLLQARLRVERSHAFAAAATGSRQSLKQQAQTSHQGHESAC